MIRFLKTIASRGTAPADPMIGGPGGWGVSPSRMRRAGRESRRLASVVLASVVVPLAGAQDPPKRANPAFWIQVERRPLNESDAPEDPALASLKRAAPELLDRLVREEAWFERVPEGETAEIQIELTNYSSVQEKRVRTIWGVVPPTEGGQPDRTQIVEVLTHHSVRARLRAFGTIQSFNATKTTRDHGSATSAVRGIADQIERFCKEQYWAWSADRIRRP